MKKVAAAILIAMVITTSLSGYSEKISEELSEKIVRLHIIAESNSEEDQKIKLKVRDRLLEEMKKYDCGEDVQKNTALLEKTANEVLRENGCDYTAAAEYGRFEFPTKRYENFCLPKGEYNAIRVKLGKAEGENWWCVLFPPLCMVDAATEEGEELLKETFGDNYDVVKNEKISVKIKFKIAELF